MLVKLKDNIDYKQFLPMNKNRWYKVAPQIDNNCFYWVRLPELDMVVDRKYLIFKEG